MDLTLFFLTCAVGTWLISGLLAYGIINEFRPLAVQKKKDRVICIIFGFIICTGLAVISATGRSLRSVLEKPE